MYQWRLGNKEVMYVHIMMQIVYNITQMVAAFSAQTKMQMMGTY
jgi:hypothetical protein